MTHVIAHAAMLGEFSWLKSNTSTSVHFQPRYRLKLARIITEFIFLKCDCAWLQVSVRDLYWPYTKLKTAFPRESNALTTHGQILLSDTTSAVFLVFCDCYLI